MNKPIAWWNRRPLVIIAILALTMGSSLVATPGFAVFEEPTNCRIVGNGVLEGVPFTVGSLDGTASSGFGTWTVFNDGGIIYDLVPVSVSCRLDGIAIGRSLGDVVGTDYQYVLEVWDAGDGLPAAQETLVASRSYSPSTWTDAEYPVDERVGFFVPEELPVTAGDAGHQWAWLVFTRYEEGDLVTCRYRGNDTGSAYAFVRCTGEDDGTLPVESGELVSASTLRLHVHNGCNECGTTQVELDLDIGQGEWDYFQFDVFNPEGGFFERYAGFLTSGNIMVVSLD